MPETDRFGNPIDDEVPYARGDILATVEDDYRELRKARRLIRERIESGGREAVFNFTGLERGFPVETGGLEGMDDEIAPALHAEEFEARALDHLGGSADVHDVLLANRMTAATTSTVLTLVDPGQTVVGVAPNYSHASVVRATGLAGATLVDVNSADELADALEADDVGLVAISRMDVTYEHLPADEIERVTAAAREHGVPIYMDEAGAARVAPAVLGHPRSLELDVDVVSTGLDKYGVEGPRFGLMAGREDLVSRIRSTAWGFGMEARPVSIVAALQSLRGYDPERVRELVETTKDVGREIEDRLGESLEETAVIVSLLGEDILERAVEQAGVEEPPIVPFEATAALSMLMLRDHGVLTVHFAGVPSGTGDFLIKFLPPERVERFGGQGAFADALADSLSTLAGMLESPEEIERLLLE